MGFADRTTCGQGPELIVNRSPGAVGEERRKGVDQVVAGRAGAPERVLNVLQFRLEEQAQAGHEVVGLAELRDALALPLSSQVIVSVLARPLDAVDQQDLDEPFLGLQLEPKLFLNCRED
jgi:hypothetical protein